MKTIFTSILIAIFFIMLSAPQTYAFTDKLLKPMHLRTTFDNCFGLPTMAGIVVHGVVMFILAFILLKTKTVDIERQPIKIEKITLN
jgi:hypothetical protein